MSCDAPWWCAAGALIAMTLVSRRRVNEDIGRLSHEAPRRVST